MTVSDMAMHYKVSPKTVKRWVRDMELPHAAPLEGFIGDVDRFRTSNGSTSLEYAIMVLGPRLMERIGYGYYLDGRPVSVTEVLAAADITMKT